MVYTSQGLVEYCQRVQKEPTAYMWGTLMSIITEDLIKSKKTQYPKQYTKTRTDYLRTQVAKRYGCDCSGLIKSYLFGGIGSPKYRADWDTNTAGMYLASTAKGNISSLPELPGLILYMEGHVGVYAGKRQAIECTFGKYGDGVVSTSVDGRGWTHWLMDSHIDYELDGMNEGKCACECSCCNTFFWYLVQWGDSFRRLARIFLGDEMLYKVICQFNNLDENAVIHPGDMLKIPIERK